MEIQEPQSVAMQTPNGSPVRQLSVFLHNRVGSLMALVKLLGDHSIEVLGLSVQESSELTLARLLVSDPEQAEMLFMEKGIAHVIVGVAVVELVNESRNLSHCLATLLAAEVNIHFLYPLLTRPGRGGLIAIRCDDMEVCTSALHQAGFHLLMQEELSR